MPDTIVGIDLGTTNSLVAIADAGGPRTLRDPQGRSLLPSVVRYESDPASPRGVRPAAIGFDAKDEASAHPGLTIASVKRLMGRSLADAADDAPFLGYEIVEGAHGQCRIRLPLGPSGQHAVLTPQEVSADILRALRDRASAALGTPVRKAVITVPAYFDHAQRQATVDAGRLAGLEVVRIVPEPTAAALAYGLGLRADQARRAARTVAVFDLGGGTFDVSILRLVPPGDDRGREIFQVLATAGDTHLGGDDVDRLLADRFASEILAARGQPVELRPSVRALLRAAAERAKIALSDAPSTTLSIPVDDSMVYEREVTRAELETLATPWVERAIECCRRALRDAARDALEGAAPPPSPSEWIDAVVMVGGSTRMPLVRRRVEEFFGLTPYTAIDPDEVVALGAAVQASILSGADASALLLDVVPLSLGLETAGGAVAKIIMRNAAVPARATEMFSTQVDGQTSIKLHVVQGEREMVADCRSLGVFHLRGLPPMPAGIPQVQVEFLVDANGVLNVTAHERRSGRRAQLQIVPNHGLTRDEVARMEADSLTHAKDDMARHRVVDLIANATLDLKWIGERLSALRSLLDPDYAADLERRLAQLRSMVDTASKDWRSVDPDTFYRAKHDLDHASLRLQEVSIAQSLRDGSS